MFNQSKEFASILNLIESTIYGYNFIYDVLKDKKINLNDLQHFKTFSTKKIKGFKNSKVAIKSYQKLNKKEKEKIHLFIRQTLKIDSKKEAIIEDLVISLITCFSALAKLKN